MSTESSYYAALGASSSKEGMLQSLALKATSRFFAEPLPDITGDPDYYSFLHADGAGTKSIVAYLAFRESGDLSWFKTLAQDSLVMNLDDLACVGAFDGMLLSNTIGRNRALIPDAAISEIVNGYRELVQHLQKFGISIVLAGGETADMGDAIRTLVVDSTLFARAKRADTIDTSRIADGDIIVGLSNLGQATYESVENSSMGSNGLTLARHALISGRYLTKYPEIVDPATDAAHAYKGTFGLFEIPPGMSQTVAQALLSPTRTYAPVVKLALQSLATELHGAIHCSGGGQSKIIRFGVNKHYIKDNLFPVPPLFCEIQRSLSVPWREMYTVFNMGHRMELICPASRLEEITKAAASFGIEARRIGYVKDAPKGNKVTLQTTYGDFEY